MGLLCGFFGIDGADDQPVSSYEILGAEVVGAADVHRTKALAKKAMDAGKRAKEAARKAREPLKAAKRPIQLRGEEILGALLPYVPILGAGPKTRKVEQRIQDVRQKRAQATKRAAQATEVAKKKAANARALASRADRAGDIALHRGNKGMKHAGVKPISFRGLVEIVGEIVGETQLEWLARNDPKALQQQFPGAAKALNLKGPPGSWIMWDAPNQDWNLDWYWNGTSWTIGVIAEQEGTGTRHQGSAQEVQVAISIGLQPRPAAEYHAELAEVERVAQEEADRVERERREAEEAAAEAERQKQEAAQLAEEEKTHQRELERVRREEELTEARTAGERRRQEEEEARQRQRQEEEDARQRQREEESSRRAEEAEQRRMEREAEAYRKQMEIQQQYQPEAPAYGPPGYGPPGYDPPSYDYGYPGYGPSYPLPDPTPPSFASPPFEPPGYAYQTAYDTRASTYVEEPQESEPQEEVTGYHLLGRCS